MWHVVSDSFGSHLFTFDRKTIYNFWEDYEKLTDEQRRIFDKEDPIMARLKNPDVKIPVNPEDYPYPPDAEDTSVYYEYSN